MNGEGFLASQNGDLIAIQNFDRRVLRGVTFEGNTVLHIAAREGHSELVEWILHNVEGMRDTLNYVWNTPLHEAAEGGNAEVVKILLDYNKQSASKLNQFGETPLLIACEYGHEEAAKLLVEDTPTYLILRGSSNRHTCLQAAAYEGFLDVVKLILEKTGGINIYEIFQLPKLRLQFGARSMVRFDARNSVRFAADSLLHTAVYGGQVSIVHELLRSERYITERDEFGRCAVHVAAAKGNLDIIQEFISSFPSCVTILATNFKTPLHFAVECNRYQVVKKLLSNANSESKKAILISCDRDICGNTALHLAAINAVDTQLMEYLVSFPGVKVNAVNNEGRTALDIAVAQNQKPNCASIVDILKRAGATESCITHSNSNCEDLHESKRDQGTDHSKKMEVDTVVASLIATVTFAAILQIPGGIETDSTHVQNGAAKLGLNKLFRVFLISDSLAFCASLMVVIAWLVRDRGAHMIYRPGIWILKLTSQLWLDVSIICTGIAFVTATILVVIPHNYDALKVKHLEDFKVYYTLVVTVVMIAVLPLLAMLYFLLGRWVSSVYTSTIITAVYELHGKSYFLRT